MTIVRPLCGTDNFARETLESALRLDYPRYEVLFCVARPNDSAIPVIEELLREYPDVPARLLIGDDRISENPKLNNVVKGWHAASYDWIVLADANVLMPRDYLQRLLSTWRPDAGLVCSPPAGALPGNFAAEIECAFLNGYQARWQYSADTLGFGFAQGKTMLWHKSLVAANGGIAALGTETAEDAAATKLVRRAGLRVRLVDAPFAQPLGARRALDVWHRQVRWAQLRRASFPLCYCAEIFSSSLFAVACAAVAGGAIAALAAAVVWYGCELALARIAGWPLSLRTLPALVARDVAMPLLWLNGWRGTSFVWRGNEMQARPAAAFVGE